MRKFVVLIGAVGFVACGSTRTSTRGNPDDDTHQSQNEPVECENDFECTTGVCDGGLCSDAKPCVSDHECLDGQYCHFPTSGIAWSDSIAGECVAPCVSDNDCHVGQDCYEGHCYTNATCEPTLQSQDCPPGEVCVQDTRSCSHPPSTCYFVEQCPANWICDQQNHICIDPNAVGICEINSDCRNKPGCGEDGCICIGQTCQLEGSCNPSLGNTVEQCGLGNYCERGKCQAAVGCYNGQNECTPYGLVCVDAYCVNPEPCSANNTCSDPIMTCRSTTDPPTCYPEDANECTRDEMCPATKFCDLFTGSCQLGCRDNGGCIDQCPAPMGQAYCKTHAECDTKVCHKGVCTNCYCQGDHSCNDEKVVIEGGPCKKTSDCAGGQVCAPNDPSFEVIMACITDMGDASVCKKSCRRACDTLTSMITETCPEGQQCGAGDWLTNILAFIFTGMMGDGSDTSASVCYPE